MAFGVREIANVYFISLITNKPVLFFDSLKVSTIDVTASSVKAKGGRGNGTLLTWDSDKEVKLNMEDALFDPKAFAAKSGNALTTGATTLYMREVLTVADGAPSTDNKITLSETPITNSVSVFKLNGDNMGDEISTITVSGNTASWLDANGPAIGSQVMAFYQYTSGSTAEMIEITTDTFPGFYRVVADTLFRDETDGTDKKVQFVIEKAKLMPETSIRMEAQGEPSVFSFQMEAYKPANSKQLMRLVKY